MGWLFGSAVRTTMVSPDEALAGRPGPAFDVPVHHRVLDTTLAGPWPAGTRVLYLAMGCFWGAEIQMWQTPGVVATAVGYLGGYTPNPTYEEVCTARTGHAETVLVAYDPDRLSDAGLLRRFFELHDPTQGFRQGADVGTQYRSAVYATTPAQLEAAKTVREQYTPQLARAGYGEITTELLTADEAGPFYYAEGYHQQYLDANPNGYCPVHSTGVACQVPA
jgi:peptide-methionine (S)-S-oxide reductase